MREHIAMKMSDAWYTQDEWRNLCDRLEEAVNNERKALENFYARCASEANMQGNNAAIREALKAINCINTGGLKRLLVELVESDIFDGGLINKTISAVEKARRVLSTPARNCDRFADETDAQIAFLNEVWLISVDRKTMLVRDKYENWSDEMRAKYGRWLLSPAAERKGEGDER
jgi:hypothetical protein